MQSNNPSFVSGKTIRNLRLLKDGKQRTIGKKLGFTLQAYSKIECCDEVPIHKIPSILKALGSTEAELQALIIFILPEKKAADIFKKYFYGTVLKFAFYKIVIITIQQDALFLFLCVTLLSLCLYFSVQPKLQPRKNGI